MTLIQHPHARMGTFDVKPFGLEMCVGYYYKSLMYAGLAGVSIHQ